MYLVHVLLRLFLVFAFHATMPCHPGCCRRRFLKSNIMSQQDFFTGAVFAEFPVPGSKIQWADEKEY